ncbi:MAG TPA: cytochrome c [Chthonomonadales bacterium]|nr:cytochrome c [Chthonomonadales bacterium]
MRIRRNPPARRSDGMRLVAMKRLAAIIPGTVGLLLLAGCHIDMWRQPKVKPLEQSTFFADSLSARLPVPGTVARGELREDAARYKGRVGGKLVDKFPFPITMEDMRRGQERFNIYCSPCHGRLGDGKGMIAQRGLALVRQPASYHTDRLRKIPVGHFYDVITNGFGIMYSYASRVEPDDRWRIAAYIRALQYSQNARLSDVPPEEIPKLEQTPTIGGSEAGH